MSQSVMPRGGKESNFDLAGHIYTFLAFLFWGLMPLYYRQLRMVPAAEILVQRILWSALFLGGYVAISRRREVRAFLRDRGQRKRSLVSVAVCAVSLGAMWWLYVWAVNSDHVVQASLGYYFTPLLNVALGVVVLRERLRPLEIAAIVLAATGMIVVSVSFGSIPWISLGIAASFGLYGLVKKTGHLGAALGLTLEVMTLVPAAAVYLALLSSRGESHFTTVSPLVTTLLIGNSVVAGIPLLLFGSGARRVPLSSVGFYQYVEPTIMLLLGTLFYHELFGTSQLVSFLFIWAALVLYSIHLTRSARRRKVPTDFP